MLNRCLKKFSCTIHFLLFISISLTTYAAEKIELSDIRASMDFVKDGKIINKYRQEFIDKTGVHGGTKNWETFKEEFSSKRTGGIAGEVATKFFFKAIGYQVLEDHYIYHIQRLEEELGDENGIFKDKTCTTKKGPDNGIDGLFLLEDETIEDHTHIIINEAKFRNKLSLSSSNDFGFVVGNIQQSHSKWNKPRFSWPTCFPQLNYDVETIIRTATLLDKDGTLKLYEVRDKSQTGRTVGEYASEAPKQWKIRKAYDENIKIKFN